jgi:hypothetical protein
MGAAPPCEYGEETSARGFVLPTFATLKDVLGVPKRRRRSMKRHPKEEVGGKPKKRED